MSAVQEVENAILEAVRDYIGSHSKQLGELGLAYDIAIDRSSPEQAGYRSEVRIEFSDEKGPWDVLEFLVARQGKLVVAVEDVRKWLPDVFASVVSRRQEEAGHNQPIVH